uniref:Ig-like domain-containing protein n=1 Tax=Oncorhynchus kisutch TaxID=8019 RepID=A0A8C7KJK0_ONCKI
MFITHFTLTALPGSGSHSLWALATYISGETPFPEFTVVVMLDDVQVTYYDSNMKHFIYRGHNTSDKIHEDEAQDGAYVFRIMYHHMKERYFHLKHHLNLTEGVQVQQRMAGCEMQLQEKILYENVLLTLCIRTLKTILKREKNVVMRKVPPRLRLIKKEVSGGFQVSCLAFGFYPRHINMTLLRDGQPVAEQELTGGEVLPSGDGTYQLRKSLEVSTEELKKRHNYTCTASHLSLDNKLDVSWESGTERVHLSTLSVLLVMLLVVILLGIFICVKGSVCSSLLHNNTCITDSKM